jgi:hypothetical protein
MMAIPGAWPVACAVPAMTQLVCHSRQGESSISMMAIPTASPVACTAPPMTLCG